MPPRLSWQAHDKWAHLQQGAQRSSKETRLLLKWMDELETPGDLVEKGAELLERLRTARDEARRAGLDRIARLTPAVRNALAPRIVEIVALDPLDWTMVDRAQEILSCRVDDAALVTEAVLSSIQQVLIADDLSCREDILRLLQRVMQAPGGMELVSATEGIGDAVVEATMTYRGRVLDPTENSVELAEAIVASIEKPNGPKRQSDDAAFFAEQPGVVLST